MEPQPTGINGEWSLSPEELSAIFHAKGWAYATELTGYGVPTPEGLARMISACLNVLAVNEEEAGYVTLGRFLALQDTDMPYSYDVYLHVGYVWDDKALLAQRGD
jgi:hypothetical protein